MSHHTLGLTYGFAVNAPSPPLSSTTAPILVLRHPTVLTVTRDETLQTFDTCLCRRRCSNTLSRPRRSSTHPASTSTPDVHHHLQINTRPRSTPRRTRAPFPDRPARSHKPSIDRIVEDQQHHLRACNSNSKDYHHWRDWRVWQRVYLQPLHQDLATEKGER